MAQSRDEGAHGRAWEPLRVAAGIVRLRGQIVVQRRPPTASHGAGRLELPGGKIEPGETAAEALARELCEEWGEVARELRIGAHATTLRHRYPPPGPFIELEVLHVDADAWPTAWARRLTLHDGAQVLIFDPEALPAEEFLDADRPVVVGLRRG